MDEKTYPVPCNTTACDVVRSQPTITEILDERAVRLAAELAQVNEARAALAANPEVMKCLNLVSKVIGRNY